MLTPGGSRRLPPLPSPGGTVPGTGAGAGSPGFLAYLPRTGLTPNESSIRSGLTPGALGGGGYPLLPALGAAGMFPAQPQSQSQSHPPAQPQAPVQVKPPPVKVGQASEPSDNGVTVVEDVDADLTPEEQESKRKEFLERNRVAASKFRKRKKEYIKRIEEDVQFYELEYDDMAQALMQLQQTPQSQSQPLLDLIDQAVRKGDAQGALQLVDHARQVVRRTRLFQRGGANPLAETRREREQGQGQGQKRQRK